MLYNSGMPKSEIDIGYDFSETVYATKEEVKARYNLENIDPIYEKVLRYRSFYDAETEIRNDQNWAYKICLTRSFSSLAYHFQEECMEQLIRYSQLKDDLKKEFFLRRKTFFLARLAYKNHIGVQDSTLRNLIQGKIENIPSLFYPLKAYLDALNYALRLESLSLDSIEKINAILSGDNKENPNVVYRKNDSKDVLSSLKCVSTKKIPEMMNQFLAFLKQEEIPNILKALTIPYFFLSVRPFEYCNEETAALLSKAFLYQNHLSTIGFSLDFESICFTSSKAFFEKLKISEESLDLTYTLLRFIPFEIQSLGQIKESLNELLIENVDLKKESVEKKIEGLQPNDIPVKSFQEDLALPAFPRNDSSETIEARARKLREIYPFLKKRQAHFYAGHCTIGLNYSIEDFKKSENTVYETARTSMEDLANRGFYKKLLIGKKFVYTPLPSIGEEKPELSFEEDSLTD